MNKPILDACCSGKSFWFDKNNPNNNFNLVVFDPPHLKYLGANSYMAKKYGILQQSWETDLKQGFEECIRVLKIGGTLIFKWNETQIKVSEILDLFVTQPLFGQKRLGKSHDTHWLVFMKL